MKTFSKRKLSKSHDFALGIGTQFHCNNVVFLLNDFIPLNKYLNFFVFIIQINVFIFLPG